MGKDLKWVSSLYAFLVVPGSGFCIPAVLLGSLGSRFKSNYCHIPVDKSHISSGAAGPGASLCPTFRYFSLWPQGQEESWTFQPSASVVPLTRQPRMLLHLTLNSSLFSPSNSGQFVSSWSQPDIFCIFFCRQMRHPEDSKNNFPSWEYAGSLEEST